MGIKNRSDVGNSLFVQEAVFKAILTEYPERYIKPYLELWPSFLAFKKYGNVAIPLLQMPALGPLYKFPFATYDRYYLLFERLYASFGDVTPDKTAVIDYLAQNYPLTDVLVLKQISPHPISFDIKWGVGAYRLGYERPEIDPPRAFDPANETQGEYIKYVKGYCKQVNKGYKQHTERKNIERDSTWVAWHVVEDLPSDGVEGIAYRWLERTGEEVEIAAIDQAIKRLLGAAKALKKAPKNKKTKV